MISVIAIFVIIIVCCALWSVARKPARNFRLLDYVKLELQELDGFLLSTASAPVHSEARTLPEGWVQSIYPDGR